MPALRPMTGRDAPVAAYIEGDPEWAPFWARMTALLDPLLPAYETGGKKYLTVALGCTGGKHRSVFAAERLARHFARAGRPVELTHRELGIRESFPGPGLQAAPPAPHIDPSSMNETNPAAPRTANAPHPAAPRAAQASKLDTQLAQPRSPRAALPDRR